jgi:cbb3-type cytochrome oxidase cytochrome c subunit
MSEVAKLKEQIAKSREDLKAAFESQEDGKYTAEAKEKIKGYNEELAGLVDDLQILMLIKHIQKKVLKV